MKNVRLSDFSTNIVPEVKSCNFILEFVCVCSVAQLCLTLCDPWTVAHQVSSVPGIFQTMLEWVAISFCRGFSDPGIKPESPVYLGLSGFEANILKYFIIPPFCS